MISTTSPIGFAPVGGLRRACGGGGPFRTTPSSWRAPWAPPNSSIIRAPMCAAWCSRKARSPATSSSSPKPWAFPVVGQAEGAVALAEKGDAIIIDGEDGKVLCARPRTCRRPMKKRCASGRAGRSSSGAARSRIRHARRPPHQPEHECRSARRPAATRRVGRRRHRSLPHELQFMIAHHAEGRRAGSLLSQRHQAGGRPPCHLPHSRYRFGQGRPYFQAIKEENPALAGAPCVSRWIVRACFAPSCALF